MLDCLLGNLFLLFFFHVLLQIQDQIRFRLKDSRMMLMMQPNINLIDLEATRPCMGVANDHSVIELVPPKTENINVFRCHHRSNIFTFVIQIIVAHEFFSSI